MNRLWLSLLLIPFLLVLVAGCAQQAVETEEPIQEEAAVEAPEAVGIDPSQLPPPRPDLDTAPDLYEGRYVINEQTLARMRQDAVPRDVLDALSGLQGREFTNSVDFRSAVEDAVGEGNDRFVATIMRDALLIDLADAPPAPEGEVSIAEAERRAAVREEAAPTFEIVYFDFDRSEIKPEFRGVVRRNAQKLLDNPSMQVVIEGHADERGTNEYNLALGERRAQSVRRALIAEGVPAAQMSTISYGEERPVALGHNEDAWSQNRRAVVTIQ